MDFEPTLPPPRTPGRYHVEFVCTGNICRSSSAQVVLEAVLATAGLADVVTVTSSGMTGWHIGNPMDQRSADCLARTGYDATRHRARQWDPADLDSRDLVLAMDRGHFDGLPDSDRVRMFRDFDPVDPGAELVDPYYGGPEGFEEVLLVVERTCRTLSDGIAETLGAEAASEAPSEEPDRP